jgi:hypothetical protein
VKQNYTYAVRTGAEPNRTSDKIAREREEGDERKRRRKARSQTNTQMLPLQRQREVKVCDRGAREDSRHCHCDTTR